MRLSRLWLLLAAAALALSAGVACGDDDDDDEDVDGEPTVEATAPSADGDQIDTSQIEELADGVLTVGNDGAYAPMEFEDESGELVGFAVDLINAMADELGVETEHPIAGFDSLLPSLEAERYDIVMSSMTVNPERSQIVDFVEYLSVGIGLIVREGNPEGIATFDDLCGKTVAVQKGTVHVDYLKGTTEAPGGKDAECTEAGNEGITVLEFDSDPEAVQALLAGQADAEQADFPVAAYAALQNEGQIDILDVQIEVAPYGIAVRKNSTALRGALQAAFDQVVADGTYDQLLQKWELTATKLNGE